MSTCLSSNSTTCDCTTSNLSAQGLALPKVKNDFPFRALVAGANISIDRSDHEIVISSMRIKPRVYIGINRRILTSAQTFTIDANNTAIPGYINTGIYNPTTFITTAPVAGIYDVMIQLTAQSNVLSTSQYERIITVYVNGSPRIPVYKTTFSNSMMVVSGSSLISLSAGDTIRFEIFLGSLNSTISEIIEGTDSYISISLV